MIITFFSNYLNHHQLPFCIAMNTLTRGNFYFVSTEKISEWRLDMGYKDLDSQYPFVIKAYEIGNSETIDKLVFESDVVIFGECPEEYVRKRMVSNKLSYRYSERIYKKGLWKAALPMNAAAMLKNHTKYFNKNFYLLCASAYTAYDYSIFHAYTNKAVKWGYFPETKIRDLSELLKRKRENKEVSILWAGRLIELKHPEVSIQLAEMLKLNHIPFHLNILGDGVMGEKIKNLVKEKKLDEYVTLLGKKTPDEVRKCMDLADIFLFTSDYNEGWGAVLNESMNSACAVVASHAIGSVPFLIKDSINGYIYKYGDLNDLYNKTVQLIKKKELRDTIGSNAFNTVVRLWNAQTAAERFISLSESILSGGGIDLFQEGPCSKAPILSNGWYTKK